MWNYHKGGRLLESWKYASRYTFQKWYTFEVGILGYHKNWPHSLRPLLKVSDFWESWNRISVFGIQFWLFRFPTRSLSDFSRIFLQGRRRKSKKSELDFKNRNPIPTFPEIRHHKEWPEAVRPVLMVPEYADLESIPFLKSIPRSILSRFQQSATFMVISRKVK